MNLEDQVCSFDLAKKLKEVGANQGGDIGWFWIDKNPDSGVEPILAESYLEAMGNKVSSPFYRAFTVAELGEMLPEETYAFRADGGWYGVNRKEENRDRNSIYMIPNSFHKNEADARAKMLIYVLEKKADFS